MDWTLTLTAILSSAVTGIGVYTTMRVQAALTAQRAKEAFDIAKAARDRLSLFEIEASRAFATAAHLERTEEKFTREIGRVVDEVKGLRGDLIKVLTAIQTAPQRRGRSEEDS